MNWHEFWNIEVVVLGNLWGYQLHRWFRQAIKRDRKLNKEKK